MLLAASKGLVDLRKKYRVIIDGLIGFPSQGRIHCNISSNCFPDHQSYGVHWAERKLISQSHPGKLSLLRTEFIYARKGHKSVCLLCYLVFFISDLVCRNNMNGFILFTSFWTVTQANMNLMFLLKELKSFPYRPESVPLHKIEFLQNCREKHGHGEYCPRN